MNRSHRTALVRVIRADAAANDEPVCAGLSTERIPGDLSSIWCNRCGEGTIAGMCRVEAKVKSFREIDAIATDEAREAMRQQQALYRQVDAQRRDPVLSHLYD